VGVLLKFKSDLQWRKLEIISLQHHDQTVETFFAARFIAQRNRVCPRDHYSKYTRVGDRLTSTENLSKIRNIRFAVSSRFHPLEARI